MSDLNQGEKRKQRREKIGEYEGYQVKISLDPNNSVDNLVVGIPKDINAFGIGCIVKNFTANTFPSIGATTGKIEILLNGEMVAHVPCGVICKVETKADELSIGIKFSYGRSENSESNYETRPLKRLRFQDNNRPRAQAPHPLRLGEQLFFEIEDISANGARFRSSIRNRLLWKGLELYNIDLFIPGQPPFKVNAIVTYVSKADYQNQIHIGVRFKNLSQDARLSLVQGSLHFAELDQNAPLENLKAAGFSPKFIRDQLTFSYSAGSDEYAGVLKLRHQAYLRAGKIDASTTPNKMADEFDLNSKIIIAKYRGEIVGSMRITQCFDSKDRFELDASIKMPAHLKREETIEISRLCVDQRFENTDLVLGLIERATILSVQLGVKKIITSCVSEMIPYYSKMGFYPTGLKFNLSTLGNIPHFFLLHDSRSHLKSYKLNPLYWQFTFKRSIQFLKRLRYVENAELSLMKKTQGFFTLLALKLFSKKKLPPPPKE